MSGRRAAQRPVHLLEFGLRWPPETFIRAKLDRLAARGVRITVAVADRQPRMSTGNGIRMVRVIPTGRTSLANVAAAVLRLAVTRPLRLRAVSAAAFAPRGDGRPVGRREALGRLRAYARLAALRPDIVHFEWNTGAVHFHSLVDALGCASVVSVRGGDLELYPYTPSMARLSTGYPAAFRRAAAVHCVSEASREDAVAHGLHPGKAHVIRPAVDSSAFRPPATDRPRGDTFHVLAVGWLQWRKGWEYALQAVAGLVDEGVPVAFDIVGAEPAEEMRGPSDRERIERSIDDLGLAANVTVHGTLEHEAVRALLGRADVLLHSSLAEGIPNVVLEAMACGVPVVATDVGGTSEVITNGVDGLLTPPRDPRAATDALAALWRDPERRRALGRAARARVESDFTLEAQTDCWLELYDEVLRSEAPSRPLRLVEVGLAWPPETFLRRKLEGLAERGMDVAVAAIVRRGERPPKVPDISLERLPHWEEPRLSALLGLTRDAIALVLTDRARLRSLLAAWRAKPVEAGWSKGRLRVTRLHVRLARLHADVAHFEWMPFAIACELLFDVWDFPVVVSCHGSEVLVQPYTSGKIGLADVFGRVSAVHCVSHAVERAATGQGLEPGRGRVIGSAVNPNVFRPAQSALRADGEFVVVTAGSLRWVKGYEYALEAIARLAAAGVPVRYEIAGGGPQGGELDERERLLTVAGHLGLQDRVRLHGHLAEADLITLLQRADVFLQASLSEGMPTAVLEAMACGLPVVATAVGGTSEVVADGREGLLTPPRDARAAADALAELWRDPQRRLELARAARSRTEVDRTLERQLDEFESLYRELASS